MPADARHRRRLPAAALATALAWTFWQASAWAGMNGVTALPDKECEVVRDRLEAEVPIEPGFRQLELEFPENRDGLKGTLCRLLAVGTGVHMENAEIRSLRDMQAAIRKALNGAGWHETKQTEMFTSRSEHGRHVFALYRNNAICVTTIVVRLADGITPPDGAVERGTVFLGALRPFERDWWVAVDCFHL